MGPRAESYLDQKVSKLQSTEDFMDNLQTLGIRNHGVILASDVKILGGQRAE